MSDTISESTIARIAGNLLSGSRPSAEDDTLVYWAVLQARRIAAEVRRTRPTPEAPK